MAYEEILFVHGDDAEPFLHKADEEGAVALLQDLYCYHCPGHHRIVEDRDLRRFEDDECIKDGPFIAWWNQKDGYVGFAKKVFN
jgi:hypothetical protein